MNATAALTRAVTIEPHVADDEGPRDVIHFAQYEGLRVVYTDWLGDTRLGTVRVNRKRCVDNPNCMAYPSGTLTVVNDGEVNEWGECTTHAWAAMHRDVHDWAECAACGQITEATNV